MSLRSCRLCASSRAPARPGGHHTDPVNCDAPPCLDHALSLPQLGKWRTGRPVLLEAYGEASCLWFVLFACQHPGRLPPQNPQVKPQLAPDLARCQRQYPRPSPFDGWYPSSLWECRRLSWPLRAVCRYGCGCAHCSSSVLTLTCGSQGDRSSMEDEHVVVPELSEYLDRCAAAMAPTPFVRPSSASWAVSDVLRLAQHHLRQLDGDDGGGSGVPPSQVWLACSTRHPCFRGLIHPFAVQDVVASMLREAMSSGSGTSVRSGAGDAGAGGAAVTVPQGAGSTISANAQGLMRTSIFAVCVFARICCLCIQRMLTRQRHPQIRWPCWTRCS